MVEKKERLCSKNFIKAGFVLEIWRSINGRDRWFYGILLIWLMSGGVFITDFMYRVSNFEISYTPPMPPHRYEMPWYRFEKLFMMPLIIYFILNGLIVWQMVKFFNKETIKKSVFIYLCIALVFIIWRYIQFPIENFKFKNFQCLEMLVSIITIAVFVLVSGHFAIQNQILFAFWLILFLPINQKVYKGKSSIKRRIMVVLFVVFSFVSGIYYSEYWRVLNKYYENTNSIIFN